MVAKHCHGKVHFMRYADDSVVCFEHESDAQAYLKALPKRLERLGHPITFHRGNIRKANCT